MLFATKSRIFSDGTLESYLRMCISIRLLSSNFFPFNSIFSFKKLTNRNVLRLQSNKNVANKILSTKHSNRCVKNTFLNKYLIANALCLLGVSKKYKSIYCKENE